MSNASSSAPQLRRLLCQALPGDSDLEAFCLDYFPDIHRRYSSGMDRQTKLSLLIQYSESEHIRAALAEVVQGAPASAMRPSVPLRDNRIDSSTGACLGQLATAQFSVALYRTLMVLGLSALALVFVGNTLGNQPSTARTAPAHVLCSTPPGAEVWDLRKGRSLGTTPLFIEPSVIPFAVCLRRVGFHDEVLSFAHGKLPQNEVVLRPVGSSPPEVCDVPIPIMP